MYESSDMLVALLPIKLEWGGYSEHNNNWLPVPILSRGGFLLRLMTVTITSIALSLDLTSVVLLVLPVHA